ncbi:hypothetical protein CPL00188L_CDS0073 [Escherichia phage WaterSpirit]
MILSIINPFHINNRLIFGDGLHFVGSLSSVTYLAFCLVASVIVLASRLGILTLRSSPCVAPLPQQSLPPVYVCIMTGYRF